MLLNNPVKVGVVEMERADRPLASHCTPRQANRQLRPNTSSQSMEQALFLA